MAASDFEEEAPEGTPSGGLSAVKFRQEQERLRERQELIHALRNFAEHFGAEEVYEQAKAIYLENADERAESAEKAAADSWESIVREANPSASERQKRAASGRNVRRGSPALEDAKRALGG